MSPQNFSQGDKMSPSNQILAQILNWTKRNLKALSLLKVHFKWSFVLSDKQKN